MLYSSLFSGLRIRQHSKKTSLHLDFSSKALFFSQYSVLVALDTNGGGSAPEKSMVYQDQHSRLKFDKNELIIEK